MTKIRPTGKTYPMPDSAEDGCPHQHFKYDIIDRRILSRKQHLNLLCTPKGYRWVIADTCSTKKGGGQNNPSRLPKHKRGKTYVYNILAQMWDFLTPVMVDHMKETLMVEFGLSEAAAMEFICQSRQDAFFSADPIGKENTNENEMAGRGDRPPEGSACRCCVSERSLCGRKASTNRINPYHIRVFSKALSSKFSEYIVAMTCTKRDSKHRTLAQVILNELCTLTGEETTLDNPKNRLHKILTTTSDRMALWLRQNMEDEDRKRIRGRWHEDNILKKRRLLRQKERNRRQKEKDEMKKRNEMNERKMAREKAERDEITLKEKERKKLEREKRHQAMEKFREDEKRKHKEEIERAKKESEAGKVKTNQGTGVIRGPVGHKPSNEQRQIKTKTNDEDKPSPNSTLDPARVTKHHPGITSQNAQHNTAVTPVEVTSKRSSDVTASSNQVSMGDKSSKSLVWANEILSKSGSAFSSRQKLTPVSSISKIAMLLSSQEKLPTNAGLKDNGSFSTTSQSKIVPDLSTHDNPSSVLSSTIINAIVSGSQGKSTIAESSQPKLGIALSSVENLKSKASIVTVKRTDSSNPTFEVRRTSYAEAKQKINTLKRKSASQNLSPNMPYNTNDRQARARSIEYTKIVTDLSTHDNPSSVLSSTIINAIVSGSQGKSATAEILQPKLGMALSSMENPTSKTSIVTVKRTNSSNPTFEVRSTSYAEAKQKIETLKRKSASQSLPNVPYNPNDPQALVKSIEYALNLADDWARWIDKTIQEAEQKAISYQERAKEGIQQEDMEDWNRFVEQTNEEALKWRRKRKSIDNPNNKSKPS